MIHDAEFSEFYEWASIEYETSYIDRRIYCKIHSSTIRSDKKESEADDK
jgi:hypothetical protein